MGAIMYTQPEAQSDAWFMRTPGLMHCGVPHEECLPYSCSVQQPTIIQCQRVRLASCCIIVLHHKLSCGVLPGCTDSFDTAQLQQDVATARAAGPDLVVVLVHWGPNWCWQPATDLRALGRTFLAAGADIVFGTSPHHVQVCIGSEGLSMSKTQGILCSAAFVVTIVLTRLCIMHFLETAL